MCVLRKLQPIRILDQGPTQLVEDIRGDPIPTGDQTPIVRAMAEVHQGITDSDGGSNADAAGNGRGSTGFTDSDSGSYADRAGNGPRIVWHHR